MSKLEKITPHLWFNHEAEAAAEFYTGVFKNSGIGKISYYPEAGKEYHKQQPGSVMTVEFQLDGQTFNALNGGPAFRFNEAVSFVVNCENQEEIDYYWDKLSEGGDEKAQQCGWLKDKFGLSWQVVPVALDRFLRDPDKKKIEKVMTALIKMHKISLKELEDAYND